MKARIYTFVLNISLMDLSFEDGVRCTQVEKYIQQTIDQYCKKEVVTEVARKTTISDCEPGTLWVFITSTFVDKKP